jgi:hypothetical protein
MSCSHPWKLVAPWYRWGRQEAEEGRSPRQSRPVFQKYDTSDLANEFLRDPQRSLRFTQDDLVQQVTTLAGDTIPSGPFAGRLRRFAAGTVGPASPPLRKLFLDTHKRFYLIVCELHCDVAGFPRVAREQVCEAGFVVRRRYVSYPTAAAAEARAIVSEISTLSAQLRFIDEEADGLTGKVKRLRVLKLFGEGVSASLEGRRADVEEKRAEARDRLLDWRERSGAHWVHEGWVPSGSDRIGTWEVVEDTPQELRESVFPLYPLIPDPERKDHAGQGSTLYFGVVPTGTADTDLLGNARFDDQRIYEIRCFVRRHREGCPKRLTRGDCSGELVWSLPTEEYRLAAQAMALPPGEGAPVKMVFPEGSSLQFRMQDGSATSGSLGMAQICSFSIPLITIVATFVLKLFLPIVVFVFGLFWMLRLKFCIPPSISFDAGIDAELRTLGSLGVDLDVGLDVAVAGQLNLDLRADFDRVFEFDYEGRTVGGELSGYGNEALAEFRAAVDVQAVKTDPEEVEPEDRTLLTGLEFEERVEERVVLV